MCSDMPTLWNFLMDLREIFDDTTPKFVSSQYEIELEYRLRRKRIVVFVRLARKENTKHIMKTGLIVSNLSDITFVRKYLSGLVNTFGQTSEAI